MDEYIYLVWRRRVTLLCLSVLHFYIYGVRVREGEGEAVSNHWLSDAHPGKIIFMRPLQCVDIFAQATTLSVLYKVELT